MMRVHYLTAVLLLAFTFPLVSQLPVPVPKVAPPPPAGETKMVLDVVVTPKAGHTDGPVGGLQPGDFKVFDNKAPQPVSTFAARDGAHDSAEIILLVDAVNTRYENVAFERQQIEKFLKADGGRLAYPTTLAVLMDDGIKMQQVFTKDGNGLSASLEQYAISLRSIRRSAGFYGAAERVQISLDALRQLAAVETGRPGRKIVVWVSPGWPLLSGPEVQLTAKDQDQIFGDIVGLSTALRQARITLYSVDPLGARESVLRTFYYEEFLKGVATPGRVDIGDLALEVIATQSGGFALNSNNDVASMLRRCVADAGAYYELSYEPGQAGHPNEYHHIEVQVGKPGFVARTRAGYYAQPEMAPSPAKQ